MLNRLLRPAHEHPEPARRAAAAAALAPDSAELARLLAADPAPDVRAAAARRCTDLAALTRAWAEETDAAVREALAEALAAVLPAGANTEAVRAFLASDACTDALRAAVARQATDPARWRAAIGALRSQALLCEVALTAPHAQQRMAAAERVSEVSALRALADGAKDKDRGVARLARQRLDALLQRAAHEAEADSLLAQLAALIERPGPVLSAAVELDRRWRALELRSDDPRRERWEAANRQLQARFEREHAEQRRRVQFERDLRAALDEAARAETAAAIAAARERLQALAAGVPEPSLGAEIHTALQTLAAREAVAEAAAAAPPPALEPQALAAAIAAAEALVAQVEQYARQLSSPPPADDAARPAAPAAAPTDIAVSADEANTAPPPAPGDTAEVPRDAESPVPTTAAADAGAAGAAASDHAVEPSPESGSVAGLESVQAATDDRSAADQTARIDGSGPLAAAAADASAAVEAPAPAAGGAAAPAERSAPPPSRPPRPPSAPRPPREHLRLFAAWQQIAAAARTPELTARFDAARRQIEAIVGAQEAASQAQQAAARQRLHALLHEGEQALAEGHLHAARAAVDAIRPLRALAGALPKPTQQRLGRLGQQLGELERWESFGQKTARVQLAERAEALAAAVTAEGAKPDVARVAREVQALRAEWKALDRQHAGVPRSLWERFDRACETAYAPAAQRFAEQAAQRREARARRDAFIAAAAAHAPTLLTPPQDAGADWHPDWRAVERWLREADQAWRAGDLGSVEPREWKTLDAKFRQALAPAREALAAARAQATAARQALIDEVTALAGRALERDTVAKVRDAQARWQQQARAMPVAPRDERSLWTRFRAACDAVFQARDAHRREEDSLRSASRSVLEQICEKVEQLAATAANDEAGARRALKELQQQFRDAAAQERGLVRDSRAPQRARGAGRANVAELEGRLKAAVRIVEAALGEQSSQRERATWQLVLDKERLCEELDRMILDGRVLDEAGRAQFHARWAALPNVGAAAEKRLAARRDAALAAMQDEAAAEKHGWAIEDEAEARAELLLELEMHLGLPTPPELQAQRLALQVKQLRDRFRASGPGAGNAAGDKLLAWCEKPGVASDKDRLRIERVVGRIR